MTARLVLLAMLVGMSGVVGCSKKASAPVPPPATPSVEPAEPSEPAFVEADDEPEPLPPLPAVEDPLSGGKLVAHWRAELGNKAPQQRIRAAWHLGEARAAAAPAARDLAAALLHDPVLEVRWNAGLAIQEIGPAAHPCVPDLIAFLRSCDYPDPKP